MTRLYAFRLNNQTLSVKDGGSPSSPIPSSQLVTRRLSPVSEETQEWSVFILSAVLSQQFPHSNLCTEFIIC